MGGKKAPSMRMRKAAEHLMENPGSVGAALRAAGYSEATVKNPHEVTRSKSWQELMDEFLPESLLAQKHNELLHSDNSQAVSKALELGYKVRGTFAPEKKQITGTLSLVAALGADDGFDDGLIQDDDA